MAFKIKDLDETQAPLLEHLIELRKRLVRAIGALMVAFAVCLYFADDIFGFLVRPLTVAFADTPGQGRLVYTKLYEAFFVEIKVALFAAFFISFPIIANQIWAFIAPGLYAREKKAFLPFLIATPVLFALGASLAYFVVMPTAFRWFLGFEGTAGGLPQEALPAMGDYLDLVMRFILAFGISFLLPVLLMLLNTAGPGHPRAIGLDAALHCGAGVPRRGADHPARCRLAAAPGGAVAAAVRRLDAADAAERAQAGARRAGRRRGRTRRSGLSAGRFSTSSCRT